jgi:spore coat protein A
MARISRRQLLVAGAAVGAAGFPAARVLAAGSGTVAPEAVTQAQTPLPSARIPKYVTALRTFPSRVSGASFTTRLVEAPQLVLPSGMYPPDHTEGTWVWAYQVDGRAPSWPGVSVEATRGTPTTVTYVNALPRSSRVQPLLTVDQTIHWADPLNASKPSQPYTGPVPTVVHLHGAEVQSAADGLPEAWFTADGRHGPAYTTGSATAKNAAVYCYPNTQPATTLWYHDHALGITRINVLSGMAAFYLVRDKFDTGRPDNPLRLPAGAFEIELMLQDRLFDTNGQLRFPDGSNTDADLNGPPSNPGSHPFWIPEFFGDAMVVNGRTWPTLALPVPDRQRLQRPLPADEPDGPGERVLGDAAVGGGVLADRHRRRPA